MSDATTGKPPATEPGSAARNATATPVAAALAWLPWIAAAGFALLAGFLAQAYFAARSEATLRREEATLADIENRSLQQQMEAERILSSRRLADRVAEFRPGANLAQVRMVVLSAAESSSSAQAVVAWDARSQEGELAGFRLPALASDRRYWVWIIDPPTPEPISAGTLAVDPATGGARLRLKPARPVSSSARFAISTEPAGAEPHSPGSIVLSGP
jgi:hypothetical protein